MMTPDQAIPAPALSVREGAAPDASWIMRIARHIEKWAGTYSAAAMYDQLFALSDAELARRGLSRASLAHDVSVACDTSAEA
jgi:hypothetical protein